MGFRQPNEEWTREDIEKLLAYLPLFRSPDFVPGVWQGGERVVRDGKEMITMPWVEYSADALAFNSLIHSSSLLVDPYHPDISDRIFEPGFFDSLANIRQFFSLFGRAERLCEGWQMNAYESGTVVRALESLARIAR